MDLSPCSPSISAAKSSQDGTTPLHRAAKRPAVWGWLLSQHTGTILMKQGKENTKIPSVSCWWVQLHCIGAEKICKGRLRLQRAFMRQGMLSATANSVANNEVPDGPWWLLHLLGCLSPMRPGAGSTGMQGHRACEGLVLSLCPPEWAANTLPAMICKTIPCNYPWNSLFKNPQVLQDWQNRGRKHSLLSLFPPPPPFSIASLPFLCSARFISARLQEREGGKGICLVWQKTPLL